ncbi:hypothetical protein K439DRAFT_1619849 [Ramaria rubella]|nr:hypothetical protein K439DRAFT_1619849 [Ramaria rubella]
MPQPSLPSCALLYSLHRLHTEIELDIEGRPPLRVSLNSQEVSSEAKRGGQALMLDVNGTWQGHWSNWLLTNVLAENLTNQIHSIAAVTKAIVCSDLSKEVEVNVTRKIFNLKTVVNGMVLWLLAVEVTHVTLEVVEQCSLAG